MFERLVIIINFVFCLFILSGIHTCAYLSRNRSSDPDYAADFVDDIIDDEPSIFLDDDDVIDDLVNDATEDEADFSDYRKYLHKYLLFPVYVQKLCNKFLFLKQNFIPSFLLYTYYCTILSVRCYN